MAFLQYTSGSTAQPRGVMVTQKNLLHNLQAICDGFAVSEIVGGSEVLKGVFWLPAYHDMGLIGGVLAPLFVGGTSYLMAPTSFLRRPLRWLELLSETGAHISGAPNFGYKLVLEKTSVADRSRLDLSHWRLAFCGAEPIHPDTLEDFATALEGNGFRREAFYPCYGLAEATLLAAGGDGPAAPKVLYLDRQELGRHRAVKVDRRDELSQPLIGCGWSRNGNSLSIIDPNSRVACSEGQIGEIWMRGDSVARGYWNRDGANCDTFNASLDGNSPGDFLRTGDLGFVLDGDLFVTGRLKDVIIIRGRNHYPQDLERTAEGAHEAVDLGAAFAVEGPGQERLVVVHQVKREHRRADLAEVIRTVRSAIVDEHELDPHAILLLRPVSLPITSSGKVQRNRCREQYLQGELQVLAEWQSSGAAESNGLAEKSSAKSLAVPEFLEKAKELDRQVLAGELQNWLLVWLSERANLAPGSIEPTTPFAELGIDSLTAVEISQEMDEILGLRLPPMVVWSYPTVEALAEYLAEQLQTGRIQGPAGRSRAGDYFVDCSALASANSGAWGGCRGLLEIASA